ncbi:hypothetical protein P280DRAFT_544860 [Massarina eburnea CBS 473.64]|uniref:F-box domain-containing protein n=1 Tax=Massarina eburnea CBS 473.64 TaxID=1395130 RepID=A0A6A6SGR5_9PLEO|nr:hypothetical protein P280DRAFT_544860 [Massarina eburnea CBS 473.64]
MEAPPILRLPDEILLRISARLVNPFQNVRAEKLLEEGPTDYYHDLNNVALLCRRLSSIVREVMLADPVVPFTKLDRLVRVYLEYPELAPKTHSLEVVCGFKESLNQKGDHHGWPNMVSGFKDECIDTIRKQTMDEKHKSDWISDLDGWKDDYEASRGSDQIVADFEAQDPYFGLLLVLLPNLQRLLLGTLNTTRIPALMDLLWECQPTVLSGNMSVTHEAWHHGYLMDAFLTAAPRLKQLETPLHWTNHGFTMKSYHNTPDIKMLHPFSKLQSLTIPVEIIAAMPGSKDVVMEELWPTILFPATLEHLDIVVGSADMTPLVNLPNEILLNIANHLLATDLCNLARTCNTLRPVAEKELYQNVVVPSPQTRDRGYRPDFINRICPLVITLLNRPDLAKIVRSVLVCVGKRSKTFTPEERYMAKYDKIIQAFCSECSSGRDSLGDNYIRLRRSRAWSSSLRDKSTKPWLGIMLLLLHNLDALSITFFSSIVDFANDPVCDDCSYDTCDLSELFGGGPNFDPYLVPGLRKVRALNLLARAVSMPWFQLPSLQSLLLWPHITLLGAGAYKLPEKLLYKTPKIKEISAMCWTRCLLDGEAQWGLGATGLLALEPFRSAQSVTLYLHNNVYRHGMSTGMHDKVFLTARQPGDCAALVARLTPLIPTIESLCIQFPEYAFGRHKNVQCLRNIETLSQLQHFKCLKYISIPQPLLYKSPASRIRRPITKVLPASLESICVTFPTLEIRGLLTELLQCQIDHFRNLKEVELETSIDCGEDFGVLDGDDHAIWDDLKEAGIVVYITHDPGDVKPEWYEGVKAKNVGKVADWIETLDKPEEPDIVGFTPFWDGVNVDI